MTTSIQIVFYSMYGHIYTMAEAVAEGVRSVDGCTAELLQVPELMPDEVLEQYGAKAARAVFAHVPIGDGRPAGRGRRHHLRHADPLRQHGRPDAQFP